MCEDDDRRAALQPGDVLLDPFELLLAEVAQSACLEVQHVDESDKMGAVLIEAVPAIALRSLAETLVEHFAVVAEHVVLAGNVEDVSGLETLQRLRQCVELLGLGELREVARVQNERR